MKDELCKEAVHDQARCTNCAELKAEFAIDSVKDEIQNEEDITSEQQHKPSISKVDREPVSRARDATSRRRRPGEQAKCARHSRGNDASTKGGA